jgi:hypothetical protein
MQFDFLSRCYRVSGYEVLRFTQPFSKVNNIRFSVGPICGRYVKEKIDPYTVRGEASLAGGWKVPGWHSK